MKPFNPETSFDELVALIGAIPTNAPPSEFVMHIRKGQRFIRRIYDQGVVDGIEIAEKTLIDDDNQDP